MLFLDGGLALVVLVLWLFCLFDVITTDSVLCRNLPKPLWVLIVLLLPDVGSIIWLVAGHPWPSQRPGGLPYKGNTGLNNTGRAYPSGSGGNYRTSTRPGNPDDDEAFLRQLRDRADSQRRQPPPADDDPTKS